jgi:hypothetical protein
MTSRSVSLTAHAGSRPPTPPLRRLCASWVRHGDGTSRALMPTEAARDTVVLRSSRREQRLSRRSAGLERRGRDSNPRTEVIRLRILRREQTLQSACKYACFLVRRYGGGYGWATGAPRLPPRGRPRQRGRSSPKAREHESTRAREHESTRARIVSFRVSMDRSSIAWTVVSISDRMRSSSAATAGSGGVERGDMRTACHSAPANPRGSIGSPS